MIASIDGAKNFFEDFDKDFSEVNSGLSLGPTFQALISVLFDHDRDRDRHLRSPSDPFSATILSLNRSGILLLTSHQRKMQTFKAKAEMNLMVMVPAILHPLKILILVLIFQ